MRTMSRRLGRKRFVKGSLSGHDHSDTAERPSHTTQVPLFLWARPSNIMKNKEGVFSGGGAGNWGW